MRSVIRKADTFAAALFSARKDKGWTQKQLVERIGNLVTESYISQLETGKRHENGELIRPSRDVVDALADATTHSRTEFRRLTGYLQDEGESTVDEITSEFRDALARYKQLPEAARPHVKKIVRAAIDLAVETSQTQPATEKILVPMVNEQALDQTVRYHDGSLPEISIEDAQELDRRHRAEQNKKKGPRKGPKKN